MVAGTATAVSNACPAGRPTAGPLQKEEASTTSSSSRPSTRQPPVPTAPVAAPAARRGPDMVTQLKELADLKDQGILTDAEFEAQKRKILAAS